MDSYTVNLTAANGQQSNWIGEMWNEKFEKLPDGPLTITFTATYSNGIVKTDIVNVTISDDIYDFMREHRIK